MYRCTVCGHHHHIKDGPSLPCGCVTYDDDGGIARCGCRHTNHERGSRGMTVENA